MTTMDANTVVPAIPVHPEPMMAPVVNVPVVKAPVVKVGMPVQAIPDSSRMAALCARRPLGAEHDTYQQQDM